MIFNYKMRRGEIIRMKKQTAGRDNLGKLVFYIGWPKAWSTFPIIEEVYDNE